MKAITLLLGGGLALAGCTSAPQLAVDTPPPGVVANPPVQLAVLETRLPNNARVLPTLSITVSNRTAANLSFGPGNVTIAVGPRSVQPYSVAEIAEEIRRDAAFHSYAAQTRAEVQAQALEQDVVPAPGPSAIELRARGLQEATAATSTARRALEDLYDLLAPTELKPNETLTRRVVIRPGDLRGASSAEVHIHLGNEDYPFTVRVN